MHERGKNKEVRNNKKQWREGGEREGELVKKTVELKN